MRKRSKTKGMKEAPAIYGAALTINVRAAKDQLSSLLDRAAGGEDIIITSDGEPKARLTKYEIKPKVFRVNWKLLRATMCKPGGKTSEQIIREDRDGRGW